MEHLLVLRPKSGSEVADQTATACHSLRPLIPKHLSCIAGQCTLQVLEPVRFRPSVVSRTYLKLGEKCLDTGATIKIFQFEVRLWVRSFTDRRDSRRHRPAPPVRPAPVHRIIGPSRVRRAVICPRCPPCRREYRSSVRGTVFGPGPRVRSAWTSIASVTRSHSVHRESGATRGLSPHSTTGSTEFAPLSTGMCMSSSAGPTPRGRHTGRNGIALLFHPHIGPRVPIWGCRDLKLLHPSSQVVDALNQRV
jgi:hypothetical protein